ncbi:MAG: hypothetical protein DMG97_13870, partial [Acidobacteria bacterium]
ALAARVGTGSVLLSGRASGNLGRALGVAIAVLQGFGLFAANADVPFAEIALRSADSYLLAFSRQKTKREIP